MKLFENIGEILDKTNPSTNWVELFAIALLIVGFIISVLMGNAITSYIVIFLIGIMTGRVVYLRENDTKGYVIMLGGLIAGYLLGVRYGTVILNLAFFILGNVVSYVLHKKQIIE